MINLILTFVLDWRDKLKLRKTIKFSHFNVYFNVYFSNL